MISSSLNHAFTNCSIVSGTFEFTICQFLNAVKVSLSADVAVFELELEVQAGGWLGSKNHLTEELCGFICCLTHIFLSEL